ncbi:MAG: hypothetical protein V2I63_10640 [Pseudomonadales bacterium]|jgi:hypothetical protein|nr:hypothetical protein [Pseudomonadales bacterium]
MNPCTSRATLFGALRQAFVDEGAPPETARERLVAIRQFLGAQGWRHPARITPEQIHRHVRRLNATRQDAASTALVFLYRCLGDDDDRVARQLGFARWPRPITADTWEGLARHLPDLPRAACSLVRATGVGLPILLEARVRDLRRTGTALALPGDPDRAPCLVCCDGELATAFDELQLRARRLHDLDRDAGLAEVPFGDWPLFAAPRLRWHRATGTLERGPLGVAQVEKRLADASRRILHNRPPVTALDLQAGFALARGSTTEGRRLLLERLGPAAAALLLALLRARPRARVESGPRRTRGCGES